MMRCCLLLFFLLPLYAGAQKFSAADLRQLRLYSTGIFLNGEKRQPDSTAATATLQVQPIWPKRKDGDWLFTEKTDTGHRYQVWHFYLQDDTTLLLQLLDFKDSSKAAVLAHDIQQQNSLTLGSLLARNGCGLRLKKNKSVYTATSIGNDCLAEKPGFEYTRYAVSWSANKIDWQETGYDKDDKPVPGEEYHFNRQAKSLK